MGTVYNRGKPGRPNWYIKFKDPNGRWQYRKIGTSKHLAEQVLRKIEGDVVRGRFGLPDETAPQSGAMVFNDLADRWLKHRRHLRSVEDDRLRLRKHARPVFGTKSLRDIATSDIDLFLADKQDNLAASTVAKLRCALHRMTPSLGSWRSRTPSPGRGRSE